jgi:hypothetical protein
MKAADAVSNEDFMNSKIDLFSPSSVSVDALANADLEAPQFLTNFNLALTHIPQYIEREFLDSHTSSVDTSTSTHGRMQYRLQQLDIYGK